MITNSHSLTGRYRLFIAVFFVLIAIFVCGISFGAAEGAPSTKLPVSSGSEIAYPPFCIVDAAGRANGFSVELLRAALAAMGRDVTFRTGTWAEIRGLLEKGDIQALPLVGRTPEREFLFDFTFPYMSLHGAVVVRKGTTGIRNLDDLRERKVAVMKGDNVEEFLRREDRGIEIHTTATFQDALRELSEGRHDAVVIPRLVALRLIQETGLTNLDVVDQPVEGFRQDFCFAVREGNRETLALLNEGLALVMADGTYRHLHAKWFAALELPSNRRIVIGGDHNYPPFEYMDENGRPTGFNVDLTWAIARAVGLDIEIRLGPWAEIRQGLAQGGIDAVQGMLYSPERDLTFDFTPPHTVNHYISVIRKGEGSPPTTLAELAGKRIVVQQGDIMHDFLVENGLKGQVSVVDSQEDALRELSEGMYDCALVARLTAMYWINKNDWDNLVVGRRPFLSPGYCYAVPQNHKALLAQLSEGLDALEKTGEYRRIYEKWLGVYEESPPGIMSFLKYAAIVIIPLFLLFLIFFLWSWSLRKQVAGRTAELRESVEQYRLLADNTLDAIWVMNLDLAFTYINPACLTLTGYTPEEWIGTLLAEHCDEENFAKMARIIAEEMTKGSEGSGVIFEAEILKKNREPIPVEIHGKVVYDDNGQAVCLQGVTIDISERRQAEQTLRRNEALLNAAQRISKIGGWEWDLEKQEMFWTEETYRIHDFDSNEIRPDGREHIAKSIECYAEEDRPRILSAFQHCVDKGEAYELECRFTTARGRKLWIRTAGQAVLDGGRVVKVFGNIQDITEQKQTEEAMRHQDRLLREMGGIAKIGGWGFDPVTGQGTWTDEVARIHDLDPDDETNVERGLSFYQGESRAKIEKAVSEAIEHGKPYDLELELLTAKGVHKWVRTIGEPRIENGNIVHVSGSFQDITERKLAEQHIEHLNRVLRATREVDQLIVHERNPDTLIREGCRLLVENRGYAFVLIVLTDENGRAVSWAGAGMEELSELLKPKLERGELPPCCNQARPDREVVLVEEKDGLCDACPITYVSSGMHKLCVRLVHEGESFGYLVAGMDHYLNVDEEELSLFNEMAGDLAYALNALRMEEARSESERKRESLEGQLIQAQKMESIGRLAGGVAHDYNNMLSVIIGYAELALEKVGLSEPLHGDVMAILKAAKRSANITRQLLAFARRQTVAPKVLGLNKTVESMLNMLRRLIGEDIDLAWLPGEQLWSVNIDPAQVDQILANLCVNARDAINGVGKITIDTKNVSFDDAYCSDHAGFVPGEYVQLAISDDGSGMDTETLGKIFEPFFTTKGVGRGTGLGLATVYGIVRQNNGFINVYSESEKGTTIKIYLPRHTGQAVEQYSEDVPETPISRGETILLVEDEVSILKLGTRMLERLGYVVLSASTPSDAVNLAKKHAGRINLLVTDVVMPEMNGRDLANKLQSLYPHLKTLFMSGYTANVIAHRGILEEGVCFIQKPFSKNDLAVKVREALDTVG